MLADDVRAFDARLAPDIDGLAGWYEEGRLGQVAGPLRGSLSEAIGIDGVQAYLRLRDDDGGPIGPFIQYLRTDFAVEPWGPYAPADDPQAFMRAGRLAFKWIPLEEPASVQARFPELARLAWRALYAVTKPHLVTLSGSPLRNTRIGATGERWAIEHPSQQLSDWGRLARVR